jgi:hypothetical protein
MTDTEQAVNRAAITARSAAIVLHDLWPDIQHDQQIRKLVIFLEDLCHQLVKGDPPAAADAYRAVCAVEFPSGLELDGTNGGLS